MLKSAGPIFEKCFSAIVNDVSSGNSKLGEIVRKVISYPVGIIAAFFTAPFLIIKIALTVKNPIRRMFAIIGLIVSVLLAYLAGTFLGSFVGGVFVASQVSVLMGIGFIIGTALSMFFSVVFSILVLNSVSYFFLKMSSQDVADYLHDISS